jgi:hexosaminidase
MKTDCFIWKSTSLLISGLLMSFILSSQAPFINIIPKPVNLITKKNSFIYDKNTVILYDSNIPGIVPIADIIVNQFNITKVNIPSRKNYISLSIDKKIVNPEGYKMDVNRNFIRITANTPAGLFYGTQSLIQLVNFNSRENKIPSLEISDSPAFPYRGMHLDVSRHFAPVDFVKKYIDLMSKYKFNKFHWHLTDDQGWRIEIKKYPRLTEVGAFRDSTLLGRYSDFPRKFDKTRHGGFYTQEEIKEIIDYAAARYVEIIPEIEMPGHCMAALAAYPEYACTKGPFSVWPIWGVSEDIFCPTEETFSFLTDILSEVVDLFPSKYIHIGGDEVPKKRWKESSFCQDLIKKENLKDEHELQSWFIKRIEKFVNEKGKTIIGWDEILEGGLAPNAVVMSWRGESGGVEAAKQKHNVIMTPGSHCYFDHYQSLDPGDPIAIGGYTSLEKVFNYKPVPEELSISQSKYILGAQANLWSEYFTTTSQVEYMAYPRAIALSEVLWTNSAKRDFSNFIKRIIPHHRYLKQNGVNISDHLINLEYETVNTGQNVLLKIKAPATSDIRIFFTTNSSAPNPDGPIYKDSIQIVNHTKIKYQAYFNDTPLYPVYDLEFNMHMGTGKKIELKNKPAKQYSKGGNDVLLNGIIASSDRYSDKEWLGFLDTDIEGTIDLGIADYIDRIKMRFFNYNRDGIFTPREIEIYGSKENSEFKLIGGMKLANFKDSNILDTNIRIIDKKRYRYVKIIVKNSDFAREFQKDKSEKYNWLFIDEIIIE